MKRPLALFFLALLSILPITFSYGESNVGVATWQSCNLGSLSFEIPENWQVGPGNDVSKTYFSQDNQTTLMIGMDASPANFDYGKFNITYRGSDGGQIIKPGTTASQITISYMGFLTDSFQQEIASRNIYVCILQLKDASSASSQTALTNYSFSLINSRENYCFALCSTDSDAKTLLNQIASRIRDEQYLRDLTQPVPKTQPISGPVSPSADTLEEKAIAIARIKREEERKCIDAALIIAKGNPDYYVPNTFAIKLEISNIRVIYPLEGDQYEISVIENGTGGFYKNWAFGYTNILDENKAELAQGGASLYKNDASGWTFIAADEGAGIFQETLSAAGVSADVIRELEIDIYEEFE